MSDINDFELKERVHEMQHPFKDGEPLGVRVSLMALIDPRMQKVRRRIQDAKLKLDARGKNFKADDVDDNRNELAFSAMTGWDWYGLTFNGEKPEFNRKNVFAVFAKHEWFRTQIETEVGEEKDFFTISNLI